MNLEFLGDLVATLVCTDDRNVIGASTCALCETSIGGSDVALGDALGRVASHLREAHPHYVESVEDTVHGGPTFDFTDPDEQGKRYVWLQGPHAHPHS